MNRKAMAAFAAGILSLSSLAFAADAPPPEGSAVEVREGNVWSKATYVRKEGRKLQVRYEDGTEDWILPDRMRLPSAGGAAGADAARPAEAGDAAAPAVTPEVSLDATPIEVRMDNAAQARVSPGSPLRLKATTRPAPTTAPFVKLTPVPAVQIERPGKVVVCPDTPDVIVGLPRQHRGGDQQILVIDLKNPSTVEVRQIDTQDHEFLGAADGGRFLLSKPRRDAVTVHLWQYDGQTYKPKANYTLASAKGGKRVRWASLQSPTRVVIGADGDECYLVDLNQRRAVSQFKGHVSGELQYGDGLICVTDQGSSGLVRASDFTVVSQLKNVMLFQGMSVDPSGGYAAYEHGGEIRVIKTGTGAQVGVIHGATQGQPRLISKDWLMVGDSRIYDVKTGVPVWEYRPSNLQHASLLPSGQMLLAFEDGQTSSLCLATLPDPRAAAALKSAKPEDFALAPGAQIAVVGDLGIYGAQQKEAMENLQKKVIEAGHKLVSGSARYTLSFKSAPGKTGTFAYQERPDMMHFNGPPPIRKIPAPSTDVTVVLSCDGEAIWRQEFHFSVGPIVMTMGKSIEQAVAEEAQPKAASLNGLALPSRIVKGGTLDKPATLGRSVLDMEGVGPALEPDPVLPEKEKPQPVKNVPTASTGLGEGRV